MVDEWLVDFALMRNSQRTNVFLLETFDPKRIAQLREKVLNKWFNETFKVLAKTSTGDDNPKEYENLIEFDLQRKTLTDLKKKIEITPDLMKGPLATLDGKLRQSRTVVLVQYAFMPSHAEALSDMLLAWSHDNNLYDRKSTVIVFTASLSLFSEHLRRMVHPIRVDPSTDEERRQVLKSTAKGFNELLKRKGVKPIKFNMNEDLIHASRGLTLHDIVTAACQSFFRTRDFDVEVFTSHKVSLLSNYGIEYIVPERGFESVGGYGLLKDYVTKRIINLLRDPEKAKHYGLQAPRGILLYALPGTGKTWFSKCLSKEIGLPMLKINPADFLRGIVGETEARVRQIINLMESLAPLIVFLDEFDQLTTTRSGANLDSGVSRRLQNSLLDWLGDEKRKCFVIGATNLIEQIDPAFLRSGRIDKIVLVPLPDEQARSEILKVHTKVVREMPIAEDVDLKELAAKSELWNGAELERLCLDAASLAMDDGSEEITMDYFEKALEQAGFNKEKRRVSEMHTVKTAEAQQNIDRSYLRSLMKTKPELMARIEGVVL